MYCDVLLRQAKLSAEVFRRPQLMRMGESCFENQDIGYAHRRWDAIAYLLGRFWEPDIWVSEAVRLVWQHSHRSPLRRR